MRKKRKRHRPLYIWELEVERVSLVTQHHTAGKEAQQRQNVLRRLRNFGMLPEILSRFYSSIVESILTGCITVWYDRASALDHRRLQRVLKAEDQQDSAGLSAEHLPPQSSQESCLKDLDCSHFYP